MEREGERRSFLAMALLFIFLVASSCSLVVTFAEEEKNVLLQVTERGEESFVMFMNKYGKKYGSREEYIHRLGVFLSNMKRAAMNQALDPFAVHGVTPFSDLSKEEFEAFYTGILPSYSLNSLPTAPQLPVDGLPPDFDWREKGAVTHVKMQGACGACWAFSTTGAMEGAYFISSGKLVDLSEQQLVDCDHMCDVESRTDCDDGCKGGLMTNAFEYVREAGGLEDENSYPYVGTRGECKFERQKAAVGVLNFSKISMDEDQISANLVRNGPIAVGVNAAFLQTYIGGVSCPLICSKRHVNHGVLLVGYGAKGFAPLRLGNRPFWIIKNSWSDRWGEHGYYRLCKGHGMCGIHTMASAVVTTEA
ncbi:hypothetical protein AMTRI_Chr03g139660 [Amborella trichopoda]